MSQNPYPDCSSNPDFPDIEQEMLTLWRERGAFKQSIDQRDPDKNSYVFYDGPPFANGLPHYGHLLTSYVKDLFARYHTMKGRRTERRFGWDCHGLPAEMGAEKELNVSGRAAIEAFGIEKFNAHCRESVMKYASTWEDTITRAGRWVDFENDYKTMNTDYMESVIWAFSELYKKGLVYESHRVMPYSWGAETPLSNFETKMDDAYRERTDKAVTVAFKLKERPEGAPQAENYYLLAWTTTPWTLPSNLALAVAPAMLYTPVMKDGDCYLLADWATNTYAKELGLALQEKANEVELETTRMRLRKLTQDDFGAIYQLSNEAHITSQYTPTVDEKTVKKGLRELIEQYEEAGYSEYAVLDKTTGAFMGLAGYKRLSEDGSDRDANIGITLRPKFWGLGYGKELTLALMHHAKYTLGIKHLHAFIRPDNNMSHHLFKGVGFTKLRDILDDHGKPFVHYQGPHDLPEEAYPTAGIDGAALVGLAYEPLFPYFAEQENAFKVLAGDFIEAGSGTGVVHMAPGFGEDDQRVCAENGIDMVCPVDEKGQYTDALFDIEDEFPISLKGLHVIAQTDGTCEAEPYKPEQLDKYGLANLRITNWLKLKGQLIKQEDYKHSYPHCWRTDTPLIYKAVPSWYVEVTKIKDRMVELNQNINWIPEHVKDGQFGKWLEGARDWSISRNRFWGCPIPVWRGNKGSIKVFGSIAEMEEQFGTEIKDLHKPYIDSLTFEEKGETFTRVPDVFDCWFESGSMPFAQVHYPFENKEWFEANFPADFIVEYVGQTRGWFYTLMVLGTALFDSHPFNTCIAHGIILDAKGKKLSKKLRNYPDPNEMFDTYGSDAVRFRMIKEPIMQGGNLLISEDGSDIRDVVRLSIKPIWNAYSFFTLYANADGVAGHDLITIAESEEEDDATGGACCGGSHGVGEHPMSDNVLDRYILAKLKLAVKNIDQSLANYDTPTACKAIDAFFEVLNNWYIRRNKERFWGSEKNSDKQAAYDTLYTVLLTMSKAMAPLLPFVSEKIYQALSNDESVHLADYPDVSVIPSESDLVEQMDKVRDVCNAALGIRNQEQVRVRQPLSTLTIYGQTDVTRFASVIEDELNVKHVAYSSALSDVASEQFKINFPVVGKRIGDQMKKVAGAAKQGDWEVKADGSALVGGVEIFEGEYDLTLQPKNPKGAAATASQDMLVVLDLAITPELEAEGKARDVVRFIQEARKEADLHISDRIQLWVDAPEEIANAVVANQDYITEQTLTSELVMGKVNGGFTKELELDGKALTIGLERVAS